MAVELILLSRVVLGPLALMRLIRRELAASIAVRAPVKLTVLPLVVPLRVRLVRSGHAEVCVVRFILLVTVIAVVTVIATFGFRRFATLQSNFMVSMVDSPIQKRRSSN